MINIPSKALYPIMGPNLTDTDFAPINLDREFLLKERISNTDDLIQYHQSLRTQHGAKWLIGGYLENRSLYQSSLFKEKGEDVRDIHLGVDIWGPVESLVYAPLDGTIHSFAYNAAHLDYGYTLILEHQHNKQTFYLLYGHLGEKHFDSWNVGKQIKQGEVIGSYGAQHENGGWLPHLHLQLILDMENMNGDYPGVCSVSKLDHYRSNCPNPMAVIKKGP